MIPGTNAVLSETLETVEMPSKQHRMDIEKNRIIGTCDGLEAVEQTIFKILNTERFDYLIYSWNYGIELKDLYGQAPMYVCAELERRVKEALLQDDRIESVDSFEYDMSKKGVVAVSFTAHTFYGDVDEEMAVNI